MKKNKKYKRVATDGLERYVQLPVEGLHIFLAYLKHMLILFEGVQRIDVKGQIAAEKNRIESHEMELAGWLEQGYSSRDIKAYLRDIADSLDENATSFESIEFELPARTSKQCKAIASDLDSLAGKLLEEYSIMKDQTQRLLRAELDELPMLPWLSAPK